MWLKKALISLLLLICPCAFCYGQVSFSGVNGERGYVALRASYDWDLDNGFFLIPTYGYYRMSDKEIDESGSTSRYGLEGFYELSDSWLVGAEGFWQPKAVGYQAVGYSLQTRWIPFYRWGSFTNPYIGVQGGQIRYKSYVDEQGLPLATGPFSQVETFAQLEAGADLKNWQLNAVWHKVIKYKNQAPQEITFSWADVPFMTAVLQGFIEETAALRISYQTDLVTPYLAWARYRYASMDNPSGAVSAGVHLHLWEVSLSAGVEVFEPKRKETRKTFFSVSAEVKF